MTDLDQQFEEARAARMEAEIRLAAGTAMVADPGEDEE